MIVVDIDGSEPGKPLRDKESKAMKPLAIIESKRWKDTERGNTCSMYGVLPYDSKFWVLEKVGYTVRNDNGTVGNGQIPCKTLEEAKAKWPNLPVEIA